MDNLDIKVDKEAEVFCRICGVKWLWGIASDDLRKRFVCDECKCVVANAIKDIQDALAAAEEKGVEITDATDSLHYLKDIIL